MHRMMKNRATGTTAPHDEHGAEERYPVRWAMWLL